MRLAAGQADMLEHVLEHGGHGDELRHRRFAHGLQHHIGSRRTADQHRRRAPVERNQQARPQTVGEILFRGREDDVAFAVLPEAAVPLGDEHEVVREMSDPLGGAGGAAGEEHVGHVIGMAWAGGDGGRGLEESGERHHRPARKSRGSGVAAHDARCVAAHDDRLQRSRQRRRDLGELRPLLGVDEQETGRGVADEVEQVRRLVEVGHDGRHGADAHCTEPDGHVVEAVGPEQQDAVLGPGADGGEPGRHIGDPLRQRAVADRQIIDDEGRLVLDRRAEVPLEEQDGRLDAVRHHRVHEGAPVGGIDLVVAGGRLAGQHGMTIIRA